MNLYHKEFGAGDPIIILHGLFGFSDNWQTIAKSLAQHHLVVTPDLRNHGRSPHLPTHSYPEMAEDLKAFMEEKWMFHAVLIGHSMGGKVAMQLALHYPDMVEKLVVVDMEPGPADDNHSSIFKALIGLDLPSMKERSEIDTYLQQHRIDPGTRQFLLKNVTREEDGTFTWKMNLPVLWAHFPDILAPVTGGQPFEKPTLFVRGGRSNYIKDEDWSNVTKLFPNAELATIEGAGHWVHADKPKELLEVLSRFLA